MSYVCDTILKFSILEDENEIINQVNLFFDDGQKFVMLDGDSLDEKAKFWYGGCKVFQTPIAMGAFNYIDLEGLKKHLKTKVKWEYPQEVQLIWCNEDDTNFSMQMIFRE